MWKENRLVVILLHMSNAEMTVLCMVQECERFIVRID